VLRLGSFYIPASLLIQAFHYIGIESVKILITSKEFYSEFKLYLNIYSRKILIDLALTEGADEYVSKYISVYRSTEDYSSYRQGKYLELLFSAVKRNDEATLSLCFDDPRYQEMKPEYKFNFFTYPGFATYKDQCTDDESHSGISILQLAACLDSDRAAKVILEKRGGNETARSSVGVWGNTPLHMAAWYGSVNTLELLLKHKARVNKRNMNDYSWQSWCGPDMNVTPLHALLLGSRPSRDERQEKTNKCLRLLIEYGAKVNAVTGPVSASHGALSIMDDPVFGEGNMDRICYLSPLHIAVFCQNITAVKLLLEHGAIEQRLGIENVPNLIAAENYLSYPHRLQVGGPTNNNESDKNDNDCAWEDIHEASFRDEYPSLEAACDEVYDSDLERSFDKEDLALPIEDVETDQIEPNIEENQQADEGSMSVEHETEREEGREDVEERKGEVEDGGGEVIEEQKEKEEELAQEEEGKEEELAQEEEGREEELAQEEEGKEEELAQEEEGKDEEEEEEEEANEEEEEEANEEEEKEEEMGEIMSSVYGGDTDDYSVEECDLMVEYIYQVRHKIRERDSCGRWTDNPEQNRGEATWIEIAAAKCYIRELREDANGEIVEKTNPAHVCFSELGELRFFQSFPYRRLFYPRTLAIAKAAYESTKMTNPNKYSDLLEIARLLLKSPIAAAIKGEEEVALLPPNDPTCKVEKMDESSVQTAYQVIIDFAPSLYQNDRVVKEGEGEEEVEEEGEGGEEVEEEGEGGEEVEEEGEGGEDEEGDSADYSFSSAVSEILHLTMNPLDPSVAAHFSANYAQMSAHLLNESCGRSALPLDIFHALLLLAALPVQRFYEALSSPSSTSTQQPGALTTEQIAGALESVVDKDSALYGLLLDSLGLQSGEEDKEPSSLAFSPSSTHQLLLRISGSMNSTERGKEAPLTSCILRSSDQVLELSAALLGCLVWTFLNEAVIARPRLIAGFALWRFFLEDEFTEEFSRPKVPEYLWLYIGAISESNELMQLLFPSGVNEEEVWTLAQSMRQSDESFLSFIVTTLSAKLTHLRSSDLHDIIPCLKELALDNKPVLDESTATQIIQTIVDLIEEDAEDMDWCFDGSPLTTRPSYRLKAQLRDLSWKLRDNRLLYGSVSHELVKLADAYQHIGDYKAALSVYERGIVEIASRCANEAEEEDRPPPSKKKRVADEMFEHFFSFSSVKPKKVPKESVVPDKTYLFRCYFGRGECFAALGDLDRSFDSFSTAFQMNHSSR
jgi:hypothetical protein